MKKVNGSFVMFPIVANLVALIVRPIIVAQSMLRRLASHANDGTTNFLMLMTKRPKTILTLESRSFIAGTLTEKGKHGACRPFATNGISL
jgi:hypothetical protein